MTNNGVINTNYRATRLTKLNHDHYLRCSFPYIKLEEGITKWVNDSFFCELSCIGICSVNSQCQPSNLNQQWGKLNNMIWAFGLWINCIFISKELNCFSDVMWCVENRSISLSLSMTSMERDLQMSSCRIQSV